MWTVNIINATLNLIEFDLIGRGRNLLHCLTQCILHMVIMSENNICSNFGDQFPVQKAEQGIIKGCEVHRQGPCRESGDIPEMASCHSITPTFNTNKMYITTVIRLLG